jgi:tetratricopeptide (TPR) repeat protein
MKVRLVQFLCLIVTVLLLIPVSTYGVTPYTKPDPNSLHTVPDTAPLEFLAAVDLMEYGDTVRARRLLRNTLDNYPRHEASLARYLNLVQAMEGTELTIQRAQEHVKKLGDPGVLQAFFRTLDSPVRYRPLFEWLYRKNSLQPFIARPYGQLLKSQKQYDRAETVYRTILKTFPQSTDFRLKLAEILALQGDCEEALQSLNKLLERRPGWFKPYGLKYQIQRSLDESTTDVLHIYESLIGSLKHNEVKQDEYTCDQ